MSPCKVFCCIFGLIGLIRTCASLKIVFEPEAARRVVEGQSLSVGVRVLDVLFEGDKFELLTESENEDIALATPYDQTLPSNIEEVSGFKVKAVKIGITRIRWTVFSNFTKEEDAGEYYVSVIREPNNIQLIFTIMVSILVSINNVNMGCLLDLDVIKKVLKTPIAPVIGFCCQFLFMPLGSYAIGMLFFPDNISWRLGLFTLGCSPGGTGSNFWTLLFRGDVDLSVTMTFVSSLAALGMMPLWMFTLGGKLLQEGNVQVPYLNLIISLFALTIPLAIGIGIQKYKPTWAAYLKSILRPMTAFVITLVVIGGTYISYYVFTLMNLQVIAAGLCVALGGYTFGAITAALFGLKGPQIIAVSIETALQNPGIAFVLLQLSLGQPESDLAAVPVVAQLFMTGLPMWAVYLVYVGVRRCTRKNKKTRTPTVVIHESKTAAELTPMTQPV